MASCAGVREGLRAHTGVESDDAFTTEFSGVSAHGALVSFLVTVADVDVFNVGAAFLGPVAGVVVSWGDW